MNGSEPLTNARHERFAQEIVKGKSATQAYIDAGYSPKGAGAGGHGLLKKTNVNDRIRYLEKQAADKAGWLTKEDVLDRLRIESEGLGPDTSSGARAKATELLGKYLQMWNEKQEHTGDIRIHIVRE